MAAGLCVYGFAKSFYGPWLLFEVYVAGNWSVSGLCLECVWLEP